MKAVKQIQLPHEAAAPLSQEQIKHIIKFLYPFRRHAKTINRATNPEDKKSLQGRFIYTQNDLYDLYMHIIEPSEEYGDVIVDRFDIVNYLSLIIKEEGPIEEILESNSTAEEPSLGWLCYQFRMLLETISDRNVSRGHTIEADVLDSLPVAARPRRSDTRTERPDRDGTRMMAAHYTPEVHRQFRVLAAQQGMTSHVLLNQAVALLFEHYGCEIPPSLRQKLKDHGLT